MKAINKHTKNEPKILIEYRATPNAIYKGFQDSEPLNNKDSERQPPLKTALCQEQGYLCCYCMRRIIPIATTVEHYITQNRHSESPYSEEIHKQHELDFMNMLGSCNDNGRNCSGIRGNEPLCIDPRNSQIEHQIGFLPNGVVYAIGKNPDIQKDLELLKLGTIYDPPMANQEYYIIRNREAIFDKVRHDLDKNGWTKSNCEKEIKKWQTPDTEGYLTPYCQVAIFYLRKKMKSLAS